MNNDEMYIIVSDSLVIDKALKFENAIIKSKGFKDSTIVRVTEEDIADIDRDGNKTIERWNVTKDEDGLKFDEIPFETYTESVDDGNGSEIAIRHLCSRCNNIVTRRNSIRRCCNCGCLLSW